MLFFVGTSFCMETELESVFLMDEELNVGLVDMSVDSVDVSPYVSDLSDSSDEESNKGSRSSSFSDSSILSAKLAKVAQRKNETRKMEEALAKELLAKLEKVKKERDLFCKRAEIALMEQEDAKVTQAKKLEKLAQKLVREKRKNVTKKSDRGSFPLYADLPGAGYVPY